MNDRPQNVEKLDWILMTARERRACLQRWKYENDSVYREIKKRQAREYLQKTKKKRK